MVRAENISRRTRDGIGYDKVPDLLSSLIRNRCETRVESVRKRSARRIESCLRHSVVSPLLMINTHMVQASAQGVRCERERNNIIPQGVDRTRRKRGAGKSLTNGDLAKR